MTILKNVDKNDMKRSMEKKKKNAYSACSEDCPRCRVSDG